jgi:hypothetical protein
MIALKALQGQVTALTDDLREQVGRDSELTSALEKEHGQATQARRTAGTFESWLEDVLDQAAVAWVLGCVFVRFCEDNELVEPLWIGGPEPVAPVERAVQHRQQHLIDNPRHNDRHWLREAFDYLSTLKATGKIFDQHNPLWRFDISGAAAEKLSDFFRRGAGLVSLRVEKLDTRFLGDLYQDLSTHAKKTYALLQTPDFVEEFILDRTFEPAVREFGLSQTSMIDPTCGSGHFLLGAFERLVDKWREREPGTDIRVLTERALGQVTGVDINPFAVAIARFRLLIAAMNRCGLRSLERTPAWTVRVATGDSLLHWGRTSRNQGDLLAVLEGKEGFAYVTEDADVLGDYLREGQYTVVVGNPPYIAVSDPARNQLYRSLYGTCSGKYALTIPFAERFFGLANRGDHDGVGAGHVGQITGNSFMKREFGRKLVEVFLAHGVELSEIVDTSGAFIPGHGTPTVILVGRNRIPSSRFSSTVRAVFAVRGEPAQPIEPAKGLVWSAIVAQMSNPNLRSDWVSVEDLARERFIHHPWSLSGGGARELVVFLERAAVRLRDVVQRVGVFGMTNADEVMLAGKDTWIRRTGNLWQKKRLVVGEEIRDWSCSDGNWSYFPYDDSLALAEPPEGRLLQWTWPYRTNMGSRATFNKKTYFQEGRPWYEWHQVTRDVGSSHWWLALSFVATHNHFVLDNGGKIFKQSAPVIKLPERATEDEHLQLLGLLNSSTSCFWLKQVSHDKGIRGEGGGFTSDDWEHFYEFTGTKLQDYPLPEAYSLDRARLIDLLAQRLGSLTPAAVADSGVPTRERLRLARVEYDSVRAQMIASQEELDWDVYGLYGLRDDDLTCAQPPELQLGERAFEIVLARRMAAGEVETQWFSRHGSTPITELPGHWSDEYRDLVERRIEVIESDRNIGLIERPECKRRWATEGWDAMQTKALRDWLLDRLEAPELWGDRPTPQSVAQLADKVRHDEDFRSVLELWVGRDDYDLAKALGKLVADEHVPYLPVHRYRPSGLRKRAQWERTWAQQRLEDEGESVQIAVPPKYTSADFAKPSYWRARGKLDVPKERFISYSMAGRDGDGTVLLGWAGWDHLAQAQALATVYLDRKLQAAWPAERLLPLLAGIAEMEPWLHQWYADERPDFPGSPAQFFTDLVDSEVSHLGIDRITLAESSGLTEAPSHDSIRTPH